MTRTRDLNFRPYIPHVQVIFMMIYAILAVEYFAPLGQEFSEAGLGQYVTYGDNGENHTISAETSRGFVYGWEYYGTFFRAMYTLFQVMTGESWSEAVARPLMFGLYKNAILVSVYFVSFILLMQVVLTNVVVAVLLDKFVADEEPKEDGDDEEGDSSVAVSPTDFLEGKTSTRSTEAWPVNGKAGDENGTASFETITSIASSSEPTFMRVAASADADLDSKLSLILSELAAMRKEMAELKQASGISAVDLQ